MGGLMPLVCLALESSAAARPIVTLVVVPEAPVAPGHIVATASISGSDTILAYRWGTLEVAPRCRGPRCAFDVSVASCRRIEVEVTTSLGETVTATRALCVNDELGGRPPQANLRVSTTSASPSVQIGGDAVWGSDPVVVSRLWIDDQEQSGLFASITKDGGCHAVDLLVADKRGRIGIDRRSVCATDTAPVVWLGATPDPCPELGTRIERCGEASSPLGLSLNEVAGTVPLAGCGPMELAPDGFVRSFVRVQDSSGALSTASLFSCSAPASSPHRLLFASMPQSIPPLASGQEILVPLSIYGALAPITVDASLTPVGNDQGMNTPATMGSTVSMWNVHVVGASMMGSYRLDVLVKDARQLSAHASTLVEVSTNGATDGGIVRFDSGFQDDGGQHVETTHNGCAGTIARPARPPSVLHIVLAIGAIGILRRGGRPR
jgi:hypothetical protein